MYVTLEYQDGSKISKEINSDSTISVDGVTRNANGETIAGPGVMTASCEAIVGVSLTTDDETFQAEDTSEPETSDPDLVKAIAAAEKAVDDVAKANDDEFEGKLKAARKLVSDALRHGPWKKSEQLKTSKAQLAQIADARKQA
jgi:hypothetical protein